MDDEWIYGSSPANIYESISEGRPNGMPSWGGHIPDYQIWELVTYVQGSMKNLSTPPSGPAMRGLASRIASDPDLGRVYREQVVEPRREQLRPVVERGIARGDLRPDTDVRLVHELLVGPIFYRLLFSGGPLDRKLSARLADAILDGFAPPHLAGTASKPRHR